MNDLDDKGIKYNKKMIYIVIVIISTTFMLFLIQKDKNEVEDINYNIEEIKKEIGKKEENIIRYRDELGIKTESEAETLRYDYQKIKESLNDTKKELSSIKDEYKELESSNELLTSKRASINEDIEKVKKEMETMVVNNTEDKISESVIPELIIAKRFNDLDAGLVASTDLEEAPGIVKLVMDDDINITYARALFQKGDSGKLEPNVDTVIKTLHTALQYKAKELNDELGSKVIVTLWFTGPNGEELIVYGTNGYAVLFDFINDINIYGEW